MLFEVFIICATIFSLWIIGKLLVLLDVVYVPKKKCVHLWRPAKNLNQAAYCSICEIMLTSNGFYCESCGVCGCESQCIDSAELVLKCKENYTQPLSTDKTIRDQMHMWIKGNLTQTYACCVCQKDIDYHGRPGLYGYRCCWCQRSSHVNCFAKAAENKVCDFGIYRNLIIPPNHVFMKRRRLQRITSIVTPEWPEWKPLIVVANLKSGDSTAAGVMATFRSVLNPIQIFELSTAGPEEALRLISKIRSVQCRILVAGGDGTVGWILNELVRKNIKPLPEVAIMPIGTGNDLSRVLNWGGVPPTELHPLELCDKIQSAEMVHLDRWHIDIEGRRSRRLHMNWLPHRKLQMYNYFSIGVDAQIALDFHKARDSPFYIFSSRVVNKLLYLCFGTQQVLDQYCVGLEKKMMLYIDEKNIELPELQSVVVLNIDSWGAGVKLWQMSSGGDYNDTRSHSISDGVIEVMGIVSSFHMAQLQVGLNKPMRLGQGRKVRIVIREPFPVQADGEPWIQSPCEVNISCNGQVTMLKCTA